MTEQTTPTVQERVAGVLSALHLALQASPFAGDPFERAAAALGRAGLLAEPPTKPQTGRDHYLEAERQIEYAEEAKSSKLERNHLLAAQVHATLALSAVRGGEHRIDWEQCGTCDGSGYAPPHPAEAATR